LALEKFLLSVPAQTLTSNGTTAGVAALSRPDFFKTFQIIIIQSDNDPAIVLQVKRVNDVSIELGPIDNNLTTRFDISAYTTADNSNISSVEQLRFFVPQDAPDKLSFESDIIEHEEEPTNAKRICIVDSLGRKIDSEFSGGLRRLATSVGAGGGSTNPSTPTLSNLAIPLVNTEVSHTLPAGTVRFLIRPRVAAKIQLALVMGDSGTTFLTISRGVTFSEGDISAASVTLYLQSDVAPNVIEILSWV